ncbi:MAG: hypothetical protein K0R18_15 [Bacillales bacterium]|jgi:hypothetical protein|nr:hypothetical protein [Bacillales bacterium]
MVVLTLECFNDRKRYISPEDEIKIYYETNELMNIWKDIVFKNSNQRITELSSSHQKIISNIIPYLEISFQNEKNIGPQLDKLIVRVILWSASCIFPTQNKKRLIDEIFAKTKTSIFQYFHHEMLVKAYLGVKDVESAINVIKHMFDKDHTAFYFAILKYNPSKFINKEFSKSLENYRNRSSVKLLAKGEKVDLNDVSYSDLLEIIYKVQEQTAEELLADQL